MRVLIAPGPYAGALDAVQVATAMAEGWSRGAPHDVLDLLPLGEGGTGFVDAVAAVPGSQVVPLVIRDPLGRPVPASVVVLDIGGVRTAYLEAAQAIGTHLLAAHEIDPSRTSSVGVADLLEAALDLHAERVVVGVGPAAALDAGAGLLAGLGVRADGPLGSGAEGLALVASIDAPSLRVARGRFREVDLVLATDEDLPLLGFHGLAAQRGQDAGIGPEASQRLESILGRFVDLVTAAHGQHDLLTNRPRRLDKEKGAGSGGGVGHGLLLLGASTGGATEELANAVGLHDRLRRCDLVVTGTGRFDWECVRAGVIREVANRAADVPVPVVAVSLESRVGRREAMALGLSGTYSLGEHPDQVRAAWSDPVRFLEERTERLARTWSPPP